MLSLNAMLHAAAAVGECAARTQELLRDAARQGVSAQQLMLAALQTSSSAAAADTPAGTPADKERQLLVSSACYGCCAPHCIAHLACCFDSQSAVAGYPSVTVRRGKACTATLFLKIWP